MAEDSHLDINIKRSWDSVGGALAAWASRQWVTKQIAYNLVRKEKETDLSIISMREKACSTCPYNKNNVCKLCNCLLEVKQKSRTNWNMKTMKIEITHCPNGRWGDSELIALSN